MISTNEFLANNTLEAIKAIERMEKPMKGKYVPLVRGNRKLDKGIFNFSVMPVVTCGMRCKGCYAVKSLMYPEVRKSRLYNTWLAIHRLDFLKIAIIEQIKRAKTINFVRIHVAGDFFSEDYLNMWLEVAQWVKDNRSQVKLYTYTKTGYGDILNNSGINCVESTLPNGKPNFDTIDELEKIRKEYDGYKICPATLNKDVKCGVTCKLCMNHKKVLFVRH